MAKVGGIFFELSANVARLQTDLNKANTMIGGFARQASKVMGMIGAGGGIVAGLYAFKRFAESIMESVGSLGELSESLGMSVEEVQKWQYAAAEGGVKGDKFAKSVGILSGVSLEAAKGSKEQASAFKTLGISVTNTDGTLKDANEILLEMADAFSKMPDGIQKTALAKKLLGRAGAELISTLNKGRAGLEEYWASLGKGSIVTAATAKKWDELGDNLERLKKKLMSASAEGLANFSQQLLTIIGRVERLIDRIQKLQKLLGVRDFEEELKPYANIKGADIKDIYKIGQSYNVGYRAKVTAKRPKDIIVNEEAEKAAKKAADEAKKWADELAKDADNVLMQQSIMEKKNLAELNEMKLQQEKDLLAEQLKDWEIIRAYEGKAFQEYIEAQDKALNEYMKQMEPLTNTMGDMFYDAMTGNFKDFGEYATNLWRSVARVMANQLANDLAKYAYEGLKGIFGMKSGGGIDFSNLSGIGEGIFKLLGGLGNWGSAAHGNVFNNGRIMKYARGGLVFSPTVFPMAGGAGLMGEAGPEAVVPLKRNSSGDLGVSSEGGGGTIINIMAADARSFEDLCKRNPQAIIGPVEKALRSNSSIRHTIKQTR